MSPKALPQPAPLSLPQYALKAGESDRFKGNDSALEFMRFGYFGEVGGLLASLKKAGRDRLEETQSEFAAEELGDALWYLMGAAFQLKVSPDEMGDACIRLLRKQFKETDLPAVTPITFRQIDGLIDIHRDSDEINRSKQLGVLANAAGVLAQTSDSQLATLPKPRQCEHFGKLMMELVLTCASFNLHVEDVARANLEKISSRWPGENPQYGRFFDCPTEYPEHEQLPRELSIEFIERGSPKDGYVVQRLHGVFIGDRLTDNSNEPDDYRFHDVFHLAYMAYLGWSPVMRALLKRKRKSKSSVDENEDGARAMIIEEGIATWIFNHAKRRNFYKNVEIGKLEYGLLKQIQNMVSGYEVSSCKLWQWELAILKGFEVFRQIREHRGGIVSVDMINHLLTFEPLKK